MDTSQLEALIIAMPLLSMVVSVASNIIAMSKNRDDKVKAFTEIQVGLKQVIHEVESMSKNVDSVVLKTASLEQKTALNERDLDAAFKRIDDLRQQIGEVRESLDSLIKSLIT